VGLLDKLRRLECSAADSLQSFLLKDGTRHYYDPMSGKLFLHSVACLRAQGDGETSFPEPPETIKALTRARDRASAVEQAAGGLFPYDKDALVEHGEIVPRSMVAGRELGDPIEDLSE
jgi:hypothetical protein